MKRLLGSGPRFSGLGCFRTAVRAPDTRKALSEARPDLPPLKRVRIGHSRTPIRYHALPRPDPWCFRDTGASSRGPQRGERPRDPAGPDVARTTPETPANQRERYTDPR